MSMTISNNNQIKCEFPQLYANGEYWLDFSSFVQLSKQPSTCLYRILQTLPDVPTFKYKNRIYYKTTFCFSFWKNVSDFNR